MTVTTLASANDVSTTFHHCRAALGDRVLRLQDEPLAILKGLYRQKMAAKRRLLERM